MKSANNYKNMARFLPKMFSTIRTFTASFFSYSRPSQIKYAARWSNKVKSVLEFQDEIKSYLMSDEIFQSESSQKIWYKMN